MVLVVWVRSNGYGVIARVVGTNIKYFVLT